MAISASFTFSGVATPLVKKSVAAATSFTATIDDLSGIQQVEWSIVGTDGETEASDYTLTPSGSKGSVVTITSGAAFTGAMLRARVSSGGFSDTKQAIFYVESTSGLEPLIFNELLESDSNAGYVRKLNATTATIEGAAGFNAQASTVDIATTGTAGTTNVGTRSTEVVTVGNSAGALSLAGSTAATNANTSITLRAPIVNVNVTGAGGTTNIATRAGEDTNLGNATGSLAVTADAVTVTTPTATFSGDIRANGAARYTTGDFNSGAEDGDAHFYGSADVYVETTAGDIFVTAGGAGKTITIDADNVEITGTLTNNGLPIGGGSYTFANGSGLDEAAGAVSVDLTDTGKFTDAGVASRALVLDGSSRVIATALRRTSGNLRVETITSGDLTMAVASSGGKVTLGVGGSAKEEITTSAGALKKEQFDSATGATSCVDLYAPAGCSHTYVGTLAVTCATSLTETVGSATRTVTVSGANTTHTYSGTYDFVAAATTFSPTGLFKVDGDYPIDLWAGSASGAQQGLSRLRVVADSAGANAILDYNGTTGIQLVTDPTGICWLHVPQSGAAFSLRHSGTNRITMNSTGLGFFGATPVAQPSALTAAVGGTINSGDATTDTEIANMRTRIAQLETKLQSLGLLA